MYSGARDNDGHVRRWEEEGGTGGVVWRIDGDGEGRRRAEDKDVDLVCICCPF